MADANITWISGPVLRARTQVAFSINEAALVGEQRLLGEVIRLNGQEAVIQVYENTTGLRPGDPISATGTALSVSLGPGLLGNIFDGLLRPLTGQGHYVAPGVDRANARGLYPFLPLVRPGERLAAGRPFAAVQRSDARAQRCLVPPGCEGEVISIEPAGQYADD
ncbi:MAG: ATPase, partial [Thiogranum sp.]